MGEVEDVGFVFTVRTIADGIHWIPGVMPENVLFKPDIANSFIIEHDDSVVIIDTGAGSAFRQTLRRFFAGRSYESATLVNTHFHPDHVSNNIILNELDAQRKTHVIHPASEPLIDLVDLVANEVRLSAEQDYWVFKLDGPLPMTLAAAGAEAWVRRAPRSAYRYLLPVIGWLNIQKHKPIGSRSDYIMPLRPCDRETLRIGSREFQGWRAGDLLMIDDRGHTADSLTIYDTRHQLLLTGDLTFEDNPLWPSGTYQRMIDNLRDFRSLVDEGVVSLFSDGHLTDVFTSRSEITAIFERLIDDHERRRAAVLAVARERNLSTVDDVRRVLLKENAEFALLARSGEFPRAYRWTRAIVALALREANSERSEQIAAHSSLSRQLE